VGVSEQHATVEDVFKSIIYRALEQLGAIFADFGEQLYPQKNYLSHTYRERFELIF
jgi:hypothetical protein